MPQPKARQRRSNNPPKVRGPFDRPRVAVAYDPDRGLTHQSFKDECDINRIIETYARTGIIPTRRMEPHYGDAPEATLFEAACAQAAIRTAEEDGFEMSSETPSEAPESTNVEQVGDTPTPDPDPDPEAAQGDQSGS